MPIFYKDAITRLRRSGSSYHAPNSVRDSPKMLQSSTGCCADDICFKGSNIMGNGLQKYGITRELVSTAHHEPDASTLTLIRNHPELLTVKHIRLGGTVWHYAAKRGNTDLLNSLIRFAATRVQDASLQQQQQFIALLLNQSYGLGETPLMLACAGGHMNAASILLQHGADPQETDRRGKNNCLHLAAACGHVKVIQVVLQTTADFSLQSNTQGHSVHSVPQSAAAAATAAAAAAAGRGARARTHDAASAAAQQHGLQTQAAGAALLDSGDMYGLTPLHIAICKQRHEAVAALLQAGASLSAANTMPVKAAVTPSMPRGTTPLHAAVRIGDQQIVLQILACHLQRLGGTAAGSSADPRLLRDERRQLPWHVAKHLGRSSATCELLNPAAPLREQMQLAVQSADPVLNPSSATAAQRASSAAHGVSSSTAGISLPVSAVHMRSLQEIAAVQLKQLLLDQAARIAAAAGVHMASPTQNNLSRSCSGRSSWRQSASKNMHMHVRAHGGSMLDEQFASSAEDCNNRLQDVLQELLLLLQAQPLQLADSTIQEIQKFCAQLQHISSRAAVGRASTAASGTCQAPHVATTGSNQQPERQAATAHLSSSSAAAGQITQHYQLSTHQLLDLILSHLLTASECQPLQQDECSCTDAWAPCNKSASKTAGESAAAAADAAAGAKILPNFAGSAFDRVLMSSSSSSSRQTATEDPSCHVAGAATAGQQTQATPDTAFTARGSHYKLHQLLRQLQVLCMHHAEGQGFSINSSSGSSGLPGSSGPSGSSSLSGPSGSLGPSGSQPQECGVCLEMKPLLMLSIQPCKHMLCTNCFQMLVELIKCKPAQCPFCRTAMAGCAAF